MSGHDRVQDALGPRGLTRLLDRIVARLERGSPLDGTVTLVEASDDEREAVARLLGRMPSLGTSIRVPLVELDQIIRRAELAVDLAAAVRILRGPCIDRRAERARDEAEWNLVWSSVSSRTTLRAELAAWVDGMRRDGILKRAASGDPEVGLELLERAIQIVERLPNIDGLLLTTLAAAICGDSHALDPGQPITGLVLRALSCLSGTTLPPDPAGRRALWEQFGVVCDELSTPVLVLNLLGDSGSSLGRALAIHREVGEPYRISTRQLARETGAIGHASTVRICENVSVLAAAANCLGATCPPMVCIEGQPKTAGRLLLDRLRQGGCGLLYHGDFDWPGIGIANLLVQRHGVQPWRMTATDYESHASGGLLLSGQPVVADWDPHLAPAMKRRGEIVHEEAVIDALLHDLEQAGLDRTTAR